MKVQGEGGGHQQKVFWQTASEWSFLQTENFVSNVWLLWSVVAGTSTFPLVSNVYGIKEWSKLLVSSPSLQNAVMSICWCPLTGSHTWSTRVNPFVLSSFGWKRNTLRNSRLLCVWDLFSQREYFQVLKKFRPWVWDNLGICFNSYSTICWWVFEWLHWVITEFVGRILLFLGKMIHGSH